MKEIWKDIPGYEGYYQVSNYGRVKGLKRFVPHAKNNGRWLQEKELKGRKSKPGYLFVSLYILGEEKKIQIHQLVMQAFIGSPPHGHCVNHINGNKKDNRLLNLEYVTYAENTRHKTYVLGKHNKGERHGMSKFTREAVLKCRELRMTGMTYNKIGETMLSVYGIDVHPNSIGKIIRRERWCHL